MDHVREQQVGRRARGFTFLETIAAAALLGLLASVLFGALNMMVASQKRQQQRLACAELGNRLILMYLDDKESMPSSVSPIPYAGDDYRWALSETPVDIVPARPDVAMERAAESRGLRLDRIQNVTVRVWLGDASGGAAAYDESVPFAVLTRMVDPIGRAIRNPDSAEYLLKDPNAARFQEFMNDLQRFSNRGGGATPRGGGTPPPSPPGSGKK